MPSLPIQLKRISSVAFFVPLAAAMQAGCSRPQPPAAPTPTEGAVIGSPASGKKTLTLGGYTVPKEAYAEIIPLFQKHWKAKTGQDVEFRQSYEASGTQARNIVNGLEADVAALSLESDINKIQKAGLITHDWKQSPHGGMVSYSVVALVTRKGNPMGIKDWGDLTKPGVEVLTPNPSTSGGAKWNVLGIYGAGLGANKDAKAAQALLAGVRKNITVMDKSGRESFSTFEHGAGDVAITYENEALRAMEGGRNYDLVIPAATVLIENPAAVVDTYAEKHGVKDVAQAFVEFLYTDAAQRAYAKHHFRPVQPNIAKEFARQYPTPPRLFTVASLGGWKAVDASVFGPSGAWAEANAQARP
jgi:sulfate transport system substrate-binding protein